MPCHNGGAFLEEALVSIRSQSRSPDEVIVVDDGSSDDSAAVAASFGARVISQPNLGDGAARNTGLRAATGDVIAWLDADDTWRPHHLQVVGDLLGRHPDAAAAFGAVRRFGTSNTLIPGYVPTHSPGNVVREAFSDWLHTTISAVVRRPALLEIGGFDEHERYGVDFDLWLRLSHEHPMVSTHEVTADWRWHGNQQSAARHRQIAAVYRYRRKFLDHLQEQGEVQLAAMLEKDFARIWIRDVRSAVQDDDVLLLGVLRESVSLVPGLSWTDSRTWSWAARRPSAARRAAAIRRSIRALRRTI